MNRRFIFPGWLYVLKELIIRRDIFFYFLTPTEDTISSLSEGCGEGTYDSLVDRSGYPITGGNTHTRPNTPRVLYCSSRTLTYHPWVVPVESLPTPTSSPPPRDPWCHPVRKQNRELRHTPSDTQDKDSETSLSNRETNGRTPIIKYTDWVQWLWRCESSWPTQWQF